MGLKKSFQSAIHVWWLYWFSYPISLPAPFLPARVSAEWNVPTVTACRSSSSPPLNYSPPCWEWHEMRKGKIKIQLTLSARRGRFCCCCPRVSLCDWLRTHFCIARCFSRLCVRQPEGDELALFDINGWQQHMLCLLWQSCDLEGISIWGRGIITSSVGPLFSLQSLMTVIAPSHLSSEGMSHYMQFFYGWQLNRALLCIPIHTLTHAHRVSNSSCSCSIKPIRGHSVQWGGESVLPPPMCADSPSGKRHKVGGRDHWPQREAGESSSALNFYSNKLRFSSFMM